MSSVEMKRVLVTGGAGYIGSHTVVEMMKTGAYQPVIVDNLYNSNAECVKRIERITGQKVELIQMDLLDRVKLRELFTKYDFYAVIHFAGLKAVGESVQKPLLYYRTNIDIALNLIEAMQEFNVKNFIFSSSACVYGSPERLPLDETQPAGNCSNPYGKTKYFVEEILSDVSRVHPDWNVIILRYFNPVGAHESGEIGEYPNGAPNNLMPFITQVAVGTRKELTVFGNDYDTRDGTGVRDYIHVVDLAIGHVSALEKLKENCHLKTYNLGTGRGVSVLELVTAMEKASGRKIPYKIAERREGDLATVYADPSLAEKELNWKATRTLEEFCRDSWKWQSQNPNGYH